MNRSVVLLLVLLVSVQCGFAEDGKAVVTEKKKPARPAWLDHYLKRVGWSTGTFPEMTYANDLKVGSVGRIDSMLPLDILSGRARVRLIWRLGPVDVMLNGSTTGMVTGKMHYPPSPRVYRVTGTTSYTTVVGATQTVFIVERVDVRPWEAEFSAAAKLRDRMKGKKMEDWHPKEGPPIVAGFVAFDDGVVTLLKADGTEQKVSVLSLPSAERRRVRDHIKSQKEEAERSAASRSQR